ncbi:Secretory lipase family protein [Candida parapsilosis]|uniref:Lipase n=2 Tax=Candida parapsilosis TaxID=5480 RepID=G8BHH2_CANPC|nr:uncharacterized protein CPAR2_501220 [Candida parapsilosis]KAF6044505.1 Secretory lipase family protein [Candida parapsilosis]KAF6045110.1 Secretory lipase family protein [Candida parapsilosis]KAF6048745.1 Secretory lipase family protein [Candida parapsilosis]KAF6060746.1 Secretory lipase family protein [Candida parapsilosis]KAI5900979.1 Lipase 7 [Candida parapsilosis]
MILLIWLSLLSYTVGVIALKPPHLDDFYEPPKKYHGTRLGEILKVRQPPASVRSYLAPVDAISWQLLIRSEDSFGNPNAISATILEPQDSDSTRILAYQAFENSATGDCRPSYAILAGSFETFQIQAELAFVSMALSKGWFVLIPDYEGPHSSFPAAKISAFSVMNSMRAAKTFINRDAHFAMLGYSGGAFASAWTAILQPQYAPELKIVGAAMGGTIANISAMVETVDGGPYAGLVVNILNGLGNEYPRFKYAIHRYGLNLRNYCLVSAAIHYFGSKFNVDVYKNFLQNGIIKYYFGKNSLLGKKAPKIPIFIFHSMLNEMSPISEVYKLVNQWCAQGVELQFTEDLSYNHMVEAFTGIPAALTWLDDRFESKPMPKKCVKEKRISNLMYPGSSALIKQHFKYSALLMMSKLNIFS